MNRIKELLKDKKVVAGVVAAVVLLFAVGGTTVYLANSKDGDKTTAAETQNMQTEAKKTEKTTAAMEIAQAHDTTGAGETIATETAVEVENEAGVSEETEAEQKPETVESAQPEETPHREEAVSENTGNDAEEEKEPEPAISKLEMAVGETVELKSDNTSGDINWGSTDSSIIAVSKGGTAMGLNTGTVWVAGIPADGSSMILYQITVQ